jgi:TatA/E family protein of Tat protein translocase
VIGDIFQPTHLLFILVIALLVLGPKRLPEVGKALGRGLRDFRSALSTADPREELHEHLEPFQQSMHTTPADAAPAPAPPEQSAPAPAAPAPAPPAPAQSAPAPAVPAPEPAEHKS